MVLTEIGLNLLSFEDLTRFDTLPKLQNSETLISLSLRKFLNESSQEVRTKKPLKNRNYFPVVLSSCACNFESPPS
jgi:hypothetical protein